MTRPFREAYLMQLAHVVSGRATCRRRAVGCVLADERGHVLSTGYNGVPAGFTHCTDHPCPGAEEAAGRTELCQAIHAEQNALAHCRSPQDVYFVAVTVEPCRSCLKLLLATPANLLIVGERYHDAGSLELWTRYGREWEIVDVT